MFYRQLRQDESESRYLIAVMMNVVVVEWAGIVVEIITMIQNVRLATGEAVRARIYSMERTIAADTTTGIDETIERVCTHPPVFNT